MDTTEAQRMRREQQNAETPLLRLPTELRLQIYEDVVAQTCVKIVDDRDQRRNKITGFLQVCRMMRADISPIYWARVDVCFSTHYEEVAIRSQRWLLAAPDGTRLQKALVCIRITPRKYGTLQTVVHVDTSLPDAKIWTTSDTDTWDHYAYNVIEQRILIWKSQTLARGVKGGVRVSYLLDLLRQVLPRDWVVRS